MAEVVGGNGSLALAALWGFSPLPFMPIMIPVQITICILLIIMFMGWGLGFIPSLILGWVIPAAFLTAIYYFMFTGLFGSKRDKPL